MRSAQVVSRGPVSASKYERERGKVSSVPPTVGGTDTLAMVTGLDELGGLKGAEFCEADMGESEGVRGAGLCLQTTEEEEEECNRLLLGGTEATGKGCGTSVRVGREELSWR